MAGDALDKKTGAIKWQQTAHTGVPKIKRHTKATHANSTMATDGERVVAFFGSEGLYTYDLSGKLLWKKDLGVLDAGWYTAPEMQWETGSSPVIHDGMVIIQADVQTWSTPTIHTVNGQTQILVNGMRQVGAYDFKTGHVHAARVQGARLHHSLQRNPERVRRQNGRKKYQQRLAGATSAFTSSPVANDGKVYIASEDGQVFVLKAGPAYEVLAMNEMSTPVLATPAISEGRLLLRTQDQIMAIGKK